MNKNVLTKRKKGVFYFAGLFLGLITVGVLLYTIISQATFNQPDTINRWSLALSDWTWIHEDGSSEQVTLPVTLNTPQGQEVVLQTTLPDNLPEDTVFCYLTGRSTTIYVDGEERFTYDNRTNPYPGGTVKSLVLQFKLSSKDSGKTITVVRNDTVETNGVIDCMYLGNSLGVFEVYYAREGLKVAMSLLLLAFALILGILGFIIYFMTKEGYSIIYFSFGILLVSLWLIYDAYIYQYIFGTYYLDGLFEYMIAMVAPAPFITYVNIEQGRRYQKFFTGLEILLLVDFLVITGLHYLGIASFAKTQLNMNIVIILVVVGIGSTIILDIIKKQSAEYSLMSIGFVGLMVGCILEICLINIIDNRLDGIFLVAGLYFMLLMALMHWINQIAERQIEVIEEAKSNELKANFLASMSHEIRTPINAIMGMDEMILREEENENLLRYAMNIQDASKSLLGIVNDVLDFTRIESGRMTLHPDRYELSSLLNNVVNMIQLKADVKNLELVVDIDNKLPNCLYGDEMRISQMMINLLNNAVKYTEEGTITLRVHGLTGEEGFALKVEVQDTGIGIRDVDKDKLFRDFERIEEGKNKHIEGSGLGLAITKRLADLMGGSISVESIYGTGSIFYLTIPQEIWKQEEMGDYQQRYKEYQSKRQIYRESFTAPSARILVVDDNDMNIFVVCGLLKNTLLQIDSAPSGQAMLNMAAEKHYDLILLDHMMPSMDGVEALGHLRGMEDGVNSKTPVIAMTANAAYGIRDEYLSEGFSEYISKPILGEDLERVIMRFLPAEKVRLQQVEITPSVEKDQSGDEAESPLIDQTIGLKYCGHSMELLSGMRDIFVEDSTEKIIHMEDYFMQEDWQNYRIQVHSLKSGSLNVGCIRLHELALQVEAAVKNQEIDQVKDQHRSLMKLYEETVEALKELTISVGQE